MCALYSISAVLYPIELNKANNGFLWNSSHFAWHKAYQQPLVGLINVCRPISPLAVFSHLLVDLFRDISGD